MFTTSFARPRLACAVLAGLALLPSAWAGEGRSGGLLGLDRYDEREDSGLMSRSRQKQLDLLMVGGLLAGAAWEGSESPTGRLLWRTLDAVTTTAVATSVMKVSFQRSRPAQSDNPNDWFAGSGHYSFPSGETALMAAMVTPAILEWHEEHPAAWGLVALPLYMGAARMASQGHWLSDVLAGAAVGAGAGWWAQQRQSPWMLQVLPGQVWLGWKHAF